jgi:hypothetical protein
MKATALALIICSFLAWSQPTIQQAPASAQPSCAIVKEALDDPSHIKPGMTRADVKKSFTPDGGFQFFSKSGSTTRYLYLKCSFIKIDVKFQNAAASKRGSSSPNDVVVSISKPYLEYPFTD